MARKTVLVVRYPEDTEKVLVTMEREKRGRESTPSHADRLTPEQLAAVMHSRVWARVVIVFMVLFALVCLKGCNL